MTGWDQEYDIEGLDMPHDSDFDDGGPVWAWLLFWAVTMGGGLALIFFVL